MGEDAWQQGGEQALAARAAALAERRLAMGGEAYTTPFADRPDILLLEKAQRARKLINV
jgi:hypothetical protein